MPAGPVTAVRDVSLRIAAGEHIAVRGPSGCGKSTLLHMLGCVDTPSSGTLLFEEQRRRHALRRGAEPAAAAADRLRVPALLPAADADRVGERRAAAVGGRRRQGRTPTAHARAARLRRPRRRAPTTGRRSSPAARCSAWRSHARSPTGRGCCWPTSRPASSIEATGEQIAALLDRVNADGTALVIVTHDPALADRSRRVLTMRDGRIEGETTR